MADQFAAALKGPSREWVLRHREHANSKAKIDAIIGAHNVAVARGHDADTPGYFAEVDRVLGITPSRGRTDDGDDEDGDDPMSAAAAPSSGRRAAAPSAAPVSRSGVAPGSPNPRTIRLSKAEIDAAEASGITPEEYWKNKQAAIKAGEITRH